MRAQGRRRTARGRSWMPLLLVVALICLLAAPTAAAAARHAPPPLRTGISYIWEDDAAAFVHAKEAGAQLVLAPMPWPWVAPKQLPASWNPEDPADPNYKWESFDRWVQNAVQAGLTPVLQIRGAPTWAQRCAPRVEDSPCDPDPAMLAAFATAAAKRYSGSFGGLPKVRYWQGMNEPNLSLFFNPQFVGSKAVAADLFRSLINSFYSAVKAVDPANVVIAGGLGPIAVPGYTVGPMRFARELLCMRGVRRFHPAPGDCHGGVHFDIFDVHPYTTGGPTHEGGPNDVEIGDIGKLVSLLRAADAAGRIKSRFKQTPLWITEFSWDSKPPDPGGLEMSILCRWTAEAMHNAWSAGVRTFFWFSLRDFSPDLDFDASETLESGLYLRGPTVEQDQRKRVFYAFRFPFVAYPEKKGLTFWGRTPTSRRGKVVIQVRRNGWETVAVLRASKQGVFRGLAKTGYGRNRHGAARAIYRGEASLPFGMKPVPDFYHPPFGASVE